MQQREKRAQFDNVFIDLSIHKQELREKEKEKEQEEEENQKEKQED